MEYNYLREDYPENAYKFEKQTNTKSKILEMDYQEVPEMLRKDNFTLIANQQCRKVFRKMAIKYPYRVWMKGKADALKKKMTIQSIQKQSELNL